MGQSLRARVLASLAAKQVLLLLDNYEQVVVAAPMVAELLANCPHLTVLATSRAPHFREGQRWLEAGLARKEEVGVGMRMMALHAAGILTMVQGDQAHTMALMEEFLPLTRAHGDPLQTGRALTILGMTAVQRGAHAEAARYLGESLSIARTQDSPFDLAQAIYNVGLAKSEAGFYAEAFTLIGKAHGMFDALGHTFWRMNAVGALGYICLLQANRGRAHALLMEYLALARRLEDKANIAAGLEGLAALAGVDGRGQCAVRLFAVAHGLREEVGGHLMSLRNRIVIERAVSATRELLGENAWRAAWDVGQAMTADQAITAAVEDARASGDAPEDSATLGRPSRT